MHRDLFGNWKLESPHVPGSGPPPRGPWLEDRRFQIGIAVFVVLSLLFLLLHHGSSSTSNNTPPAAPVATICDGSGAASPQAAITATFATLNAKGALAAVACYLPQERERLGAIIGVAPGGVTYTGMSVTVGTVTPRPVGKGLQAEDIVTVVTAGKSCDAGVCKLVAITSGAPDGQVVVAEVGSRWYIVSNA